MRVVHYETLAALQDLARDNLLTVDMADRIFRGPFNPDLIWSEWMIAELNMAGLTDPIGIFDPAYPELSRISWTVDTMDKNELVLSYWARGHKGHAASPADIALYETNVIEPVLSWLLCDYYRLTAMISPEGASVSIDMHEAVMVGLVNGADILGGLELAPTISLPHGGKFQGYDRFPYAPLSPGWESLG